MNQRYSEVRAAARVREPTLFVSPRIPSELELQARWFAGDFGRNFVSTTGDRIDIIQFGTWNRETGPDFSDAAISINSGDAIRGSVEIDLLDRNWELHGHATNPAFEETVLHVFVENSSREFFTRTRFHRHVPQIQINPAMLPDAFSEQLPLARPGRCQAPLKSLPGERIGSILSAAAQFRLQRKAARIQCKIGNHGRDEALFQEMAVALGYKENKLPFALLAQRLPLKHLRANSANAEALLFGVAGFLQIPDLDLCGHSTRKYVRNLWDRWWPQRDKLQRLILPAKTWRLSGSRPANHPQRRLAALSALVLDWPTFTRIASEGNQRSLCAFLIGLQHSFWNFHYTLTADSSPTEMALIGESRVAEILANVFYPFAASSGQDVWNEYLEIAGAPFESTTRHRCNASLRRRSTPLAVPHDHCPPTRPPADLRRLLSAR